MDQKTYHKKVAAFIISFISPLNNEFNENINDPGYQYSLLRSIESTIQNMMDGFMQRYGPPPEKFVKDGKSLFVSGKSVSEVIEKANKAIDEMEFDK